MRVCKNEDFRFETMDCHAVQAPLAMTGKKANAARNDGNNAEILNTPQAEAKLDSSKSSSDSKILDEKCGLQGKSQGSYLSGNDCRDFSPLAHFSLKAESPQVDSSYRRCVGNGGSKGLVWSFMDSMLWDKLWRVCCWDSRSFFMDSRLSFIDSNSCLDLSSCRASKIGERLWEFVTDRLRVSIDSKSFSSCACIWKIIGFLPISLKTILTTPKPPRAKNIPTTKPKKKAPPSIIDNIKKTPFVVVVNYTKTGVQK